MCSEFPYEFIIQGRKHLVCTNGNATQEYEYDAAGNIIGIIDGNKNPIKYITDEWGRITKIQIENEVLEQYEYDYAGNRWYVKIRYIRRHAL